MILLKINLYYVPSATQRMRMTLHSGRAFTTQSNRQTHGGESVGDTPGAQSYSAFVVR